MRLEITVKRYHLLKTGHLNKVEQFSLHQIYEGIFVFNVRAVDEANI